MFARFQLSSTKIDSESSLLILNNDQTFQKFLDLVLKNMQPTKKIKHFFKIPDMQIR